MSFKNIGHLAREDSFIFQFEHNTIEGVGLVGALSEKAEKSSFAFFHALLTFVDSESYPPWLG